MLKYQGGSGTRLNIIDPYCVKTALKGYRLSQIHRTLESSNPGVSSVDNVMFVSVGTNDSHSLDFNLETFRREFLEFKLFMSHSFPSCKVVFVSLLPRLLPKCFFKQCSCLICSFLSKFDLDSLNSRLVAMNQLIQSCIMEHCNFYFLDLYEKFRHKIVSEVHGILAVDGLHPGKIGNDLIDTEICDMYNRIRNQCSR